MSVVHFEQDVRDVLINADTGVDGSTVKIHEQLDRKLYLKVNKEHFMGRLFAKTAT